MLFSRKKKKKMADKILPQRVYITVNSIYICNVKKVFKKSRCERFMFESEIDNLL